ncbi:MAG: NAD-glutamate dehydrogenase [Gemmatimonadota bacterium]
MEHATVSKKRLDRALQALDPAGLDAPPEALAAFARLLLARGSADFLEPERFAAAVQDIQTLYRFVEQAGPSEIAVRVRPLPARPDRAVLETVMPDCPFIVNTVREYLHSRGLDIRRLLHPVLVLERGPDGRITAVKNRRAEGPRTSVTYIVIAGNLDEEDRHAVEREVRHRLDETRRVTSDFSAMIERAHSIVAELEERKADVPWRAGEFEELQELLRWLEDGGFVFLGYRGYAFEADETGREWIRVERGSGLGILRREEGSVYYEPKPVDELSEDLKARVLGGPLLIVSKTNAESPVQRRARMDYVGIKKLNVDGTVRGEHRFLGLFTAKAFSQDASTIPILRRKLREILESEGAPRGSHDYDLIVQTFNSMPKEELFLASVGQLSAIVNAVIESEGLDDVRVTARPDPLARGVNVMVILPKERFSGEVRERIQAELIEAYRGSLLNYHLSLGEGDQARLHFYLASELEDVGAVDTAELEALVRSSVRTWEERLSDVLDSAHPPERAHRLKSRHLGRFSPEYMAAVPIEIAVRDVERLESLESTGLPQVVLEEAASGRSHEWRLRIFAPSGALVLSDTVPTLENLGFRVLEADRYEMRTRDGSATSTIHLFDVESPPGWAVERADAETRVAALLRALQAGEAEDDRLNALLLSARLDWREVSVLRAYAAYAFRIGGVASRLGAERPLAEYPALARKLWELFEARLDPAREDGRTGAIRRLVDEFHDGLRAVKGIEDDRTYRRFLGLVQATLRTNYFQSAFRGGGRLLALKFDCKAIEVMPSPRPKYEVYLNGPRTEAAHLRMGDVARGGIRWSDRSEDFRVEVLGLVKTQQVKNAVIVPAGAKGAFIIKRPPADRQALLQAGRESYEEFIRSLLDVTDNVCDGELRHPEHTVTWDGPDPYLVVAADKGTAKFSDMANDLAAERDFWLGDAFASGGSHGYDHKALGITALGTWECVRRHFREMGKDPDADEFTVVGIGDMAGDVFGNGMLLARKARLLAAFDHRHIFVDPDPDPDTSWSERLRLSRLPSSSWADYDAAVLSEGGGVYERAAKAIPLSRRARERLGIEGDEELNGEALIRAILQAPVDLLWNGGIGTYMKGSVETPGDVTDPGNDSVRIDANRLRAKVIGEGGNLGLTQLARVEYALNGGRLNTDALDNSAGVDMSDHEVNLKILLNDACRRGEMDPETRNRLLSDATEAVVKAVLANNRSQSRAVSLDMRRARGAAEEFQETLTRLEREGSLDRQLEALPSTEELQVREEEGRPLTRPELAVALAYSKLHLKRAIEAADLPDDPAMEPLLKEYFPGRVLAAAGEGNLAHHHLRRHITATQLTNRFVDRMGSTSHMRLVTETGRTAADVSRMWYALLQVGEVEAVYAELDALEPEGPPETLYGLYVEVSRYLERAVGWLLANEEKEASIFETVGRFREPIRELSHQLGRLLPGARRARLRERSSALQSAGLSEETAIRFASLEYLEELLPIAKLAGDRGVDALRAGEIYFEIAEELGLSWIRGQLEELPRADSWSRRASKALLRKLQGSRARLAEAIVDYLARNAGGRATLGAFRRRHAAPLGKIRRAVEEVRAASPVELGALVVAVSSLELDGFGGEEE